MWNFVLDTPKKVKNKLDMLQSLSDIQIANKILEKGEDADNQLDESYKNLNCDIIALDKKSKEYKTV